MKQLTLRQIPDAVEKRLRKEAADRGQSLNKTVIAILQEGLGLSDSAPKNDLSEFVGVWSQAEVEEFEQHTAAFSEIDEELWK